MEHHRHFREKPTQIIRYVTNKDLFNGGINPIANENYEEPKYVTFEKRSEAEEKREPKNCVSKYDSVINQHGMVRKSHKWTTNCAFHLIDEAYYLLLCIMLVFYYSYNF